MLLDMLVRNNKKVKLLSNDKFEWYKLLTYDSNTMQELPNRINTDRTNVFDNMELLPKIKLN